MTRSLKSFFTAREQKPKKRKPAYKPTLKEIAAAKLEINRAKGITGDLS